MKINSIGFYSLNQYSLNKSQTAYSKNRFTAVDDFSAVDSFKRIPVNFTGRGALKRFKAILNMENICPSCGIKMIPQDIFLETFSKEATPTKTKESLKLLRKFRRNMHPIEKGVYKLLRKENRRGKYETVDKILQKIRPRHLEKLQSSEFKILDEIESLGEGLSVKSKIMLLNYTKNARIIISDDNKINQFKRKRFILNMEKVKNNIPEKDIGEKIYQTSIKINTSENDINAFVVKYSARTNREIVQRLVCKSVSTIEHTKPQSLGGEDLIKNFLSECEHCNSERHHTDLDEWIRIMPQMIKNIQKHMNKIIKYINRGLLKGFETYPIDIGKTLKTESKELIKLDTSRLRVKKGTETEKRQPQFLNTFCKFFLRM